MNHGSFWAIIECFLAIRVVGEEMSQMRFTVKLFYFCTCLFFVPATFAANHYESALKAYNNDKVNEAYIHVKNAIKDDPDNLSSRFLLAQILFDLRSYALAEQELYSALVQGLDLNLAIRTLGDSLLMQGKFVEALEIASDEMLNDAGRFQLGLIRAMAYRNLSKLESAQQEYARLLRRKPDDIEALLGIATVYLFTEQRSKGQRVLLKAFKVEPNNAEAWRLKALYVQNENQQKALEYLLKSNQLEPDNINTLGNLATLYMELNEYQKANEITDEILEVSPNDLQTLLLKSEILNVLGDDALSEQMIATLSNSLSVFEDADISSNSDLLLLDAMTNYKQGKLQEARVQFIKYLSTNKGNINAAVILSDIHTKLGSTREAIYLLESYPVELLTNKNFGLILAGLYFKTNKGFKAEKLVNQLYEQYPNDPDVLVFYSNTLKFSQQPQKALEFLEQNMVNDDPSFFQTLATLSFDLQYQDKSLAYIDKAIELEPTNIEYQIFKVQALHDMGEKRKSTQLLNELETKYPNEKLLQITQAMLLVEEKNYQQAKQIVQKIVQRRDRNGADWLILADIETKLGNIDQAIEIIEKVEKEPKYTRRAYFLLANLYKDQGIYDKSLELVNSILALDRLDKDALATKVELLIAIDEKKEAKRNLIILSSLMKETGVELYQLGLLNQGLEDYQTAEALISESLQKIPEALPVLIDMAKLKIRLSKVTEAKALVERVKKLTKPTDIIVQILQGDIAKVQGDYAAAFDNYAEALRINDNSAVALIKLSQVSGQNANLANAFSKKMEALLERYPERDFDRNILADHLMEQQKFVDARYHYQRLLTKPIPRINQAMALNNLALIAIDSGDVSQAISYSEQALASMEPQSPPEFLDTLGWALTLSGEPELGLTYLRDAYTMLSASNEIKYHIAYALVKLDRKAEAKEVLLSLDDSQDFDEKSKALELLKTIN